MSHPEKIELRKKYLAVRDALDPLAHKRASSLIRQRIFQHPDWRNTERILCYVSFRSEVDTHMLIQEGIRFKKKMHVPIFHPLEKELTPITELTRWGDLVKNEKTNLLEPRDETRKLVDPASIQLVLVPGMVFDRQGGRIGFGGGYFDRLLPRMPQAKYMALAFSEQIHDEQLPSEVHDVPMHAIITEKETLATIRHPGESQGPR